MSFAVKCSTCAREFGVNERYAGRTGKCPFCGEAVSFVPCDGSPLPTAPQRPVVPRQPLAAKTASDNAETTTQTAGVRQVVQLFCPTCGTRYREGQARCSYCHAPLSKEEIAAAEAEKRPPLIPWLPRVNLSEGARAGAVLLVIGLAGLVIYYFMRPMLARKDRIRTELTLVQQTLTSDDATHMLGINPLLNLVLQIPPYPWDRRTPADAYGKWQLAGFQTGTAGGTGTYDFQKREMRLTSDQATSYDAVLPPLLLVAAYAGDTEFVRQLLQEPGCNINAADGPGGMTALHAAAAAKNDPVGVVKLLLAHGADWRIRDSAGEWPVAVARSHGNAKIVQVLRARDASSP